MMASASCGWPDDVSGGTTGLVVGSDSRSHLSSSGQRQADQNHSKTLKPAAVTKCTA